MARKTLKFEIAGTVYTENKLKSILRKQLNELKQLEDYLYDLRGLDTDYHIDIDFMFQNIFGDIFFELRGKDNARMVVQIGQDDRIYWDWQDEIFE